MTMSEYSDLVKDLVQNAIEELTEAGYPTTIRNINWLYPNLQTGDIENETLRLLEEKNGVNCPSCNPQ